MDGANRESGDEPQPKPEEGPEGRPRPKVVDKRISARSGKEAPGTPSEPEARPERNEAEPSKPGEPTELPPEAPSGAGTTAERPQEVWTPEQEAEARQIAEEVARAPSRDWVVDAATGLANVARMKLARREPADAALAIDALAGILDATGPRLGEAEGPLRQVLAQLRLAYADLGSPSAGAAE